MKQRSLGCALIEDRLGLFLLRCVACTLFFCLPLFLIVASANDPAMAMLFLIPMIGLIPAYVIALILFVPVEHLLERRRFGRWVSNLLTPIVGGFGALLAITALALYHGDLSVFVRNALRDPWAFSFWIGIGVLWGVLWRMTLLVKMLPFVARRTAQA